MAHPTSTIRAEFDRIALLEGEGAWTQNSHYHDFLLRHVPPDCQHALEIGCGTGAFSRLLAARARRVTALDLSPQMIRIARVRSSQLANIDYRVADAASCDLPAEEFDCIASIATMHHLPMKPMLRRMRGALKLNGVLLVLDLMEPAGFYDLLTSAAALPVNACLRLIRSGRLRAPAAVRRAWAEHALYDSYPTLKEVRAACAEILPGARVRRHLLWRYSVVWKKVLVSGSEP